MNELFRYLKTLVKKNGPTKKDYPALNAWVDKIIEAKRAGRLNEKDLADLRKIWGNAFSLSTCQGFSFLKPHGYAGDYEIIDRLYTNYISPEPGLAHWDEYYQNHDAARAVRNRRLYLKKIIEARLKVKKKLKILNIGSGPGRDMEYFFQKHVGNGSRGVFFQCLEQDDGAIAYAGELCRDHLPQITFIKGNILRYTPTEHYDLIWASGLFDYFNDRIFVRVLNRLIPVLAPGGECIIGNFSLSNPTKNYMEMLEWHLHHRTTDQLKNLAAACGVSEKKIAIGRDATGVNLFLHIKK